MFFFYFVLDISFNSYPVFDKVAHSRLFFELCVSAEGSTQKKQNKKNPDISGQTKENNSDLINVDGHLAVQHCEWTEDFLVLFTAAQ